MIVSVSVSVDPMRSYPTFPFELIPLRRVILSLELRINVRSSVKDRIGLWPVVLDRSFVPRLSHRPSSFFRLDCPYGPIFRIVRDNYSLLAYPVSVTLDNFNLSSTVGQFTIIGIAIPRFTRRRRRSLGCKETPGVHVMHFWTVGMGCSQTQSREKRAQRSAGSWTGAVTRRSRRFGTSGVAMNGIGRDIVGGRGKTNNAERERTGGCGYLSAASLGHMSPRLPSAATTETVIFILAMMLVD